MNKLNSKTLKQLKSLIIPFNCLPEQDVNLDHYMSKDYEVPKVGDFLHENGILTSHERETLELVTPMRLTASVDPHDDRSFVNSGLSREALLIVVDSHVKSRGEGVSQNNFPDDMRTNYFYHEESGFLPIEKGNVIPFDASKEHAVMVHGRLDLITLWFDDIEEEEEE